MSRLDSYDAIGITMGTKALPSASVRADNCPPKVEMGIKWRVMAGSKANYYRMRPPGQRRVFVELERVPSQPSHQLPNYH